MALVECPECKKEISSLATACPHCGMPIKGAIAFTPAPIETIRRDARRRHGMQLASVVCVVSAFLFCAWFYFTPYLAVRGMKSALAARDAARLSSYVNFPSLKESLKANVNAMLASEIMEKKEANPFGAIGTALAAVIINPMIDAFVTPENLATLMKGYEPRLGGDSTQPPLVKDNTWSSDFDAGVEMSMSYESFDRFVVTVKQKGDVGEPISFVFNRDGTFSWKLSALRLPTEGRSNKYWQAIDRSLNSNSCPNPTQEPTVNTGGTWQPETSKDKEENQIQSATVQAETSQPSLPLAHEQMPETQSESREQTEPLELVYPGPMADFFIADGDIEKNTEPFVSSGSFSVELHSVYKGQARTSMIDNIKRMLSSGEMTASQESGNPDLLGHIITAANFDTHKKTVTFSGRQIYLDINNATIGTTRVQEVYQYDTPKYLTLGKVAGAIEFMLQGAVSGEAYSNPLREENTTKRETAPARDYKSVRSRLRGETPSTNDQQRVQTGDSFLNNIAHVNTDYMAKHPREFIIVDGTYESKKGRLKLKELEPGNNRVSVDLEVANGLGMGELHGIGSLSGRTIKSIRTEEREPCDITISLTDDFGNTASVVENGCSYYHGVSCDFSGKFTRKRIGKQNFDPYSVRRIE